MNNFEKSLDTVWNGLNYPVISMGKSSLTLWVILLNVVFVFGLVFVSTKVKNWLITLLTSKAGLNVGNWRAVITLAYYGVLGLGLIGILQSTGLDLSLFTVLTGAIGIGVGFGMQTIVSNFISGIIILLEKPIKLGDRIDVGDVSGNVKEISVRATTILTNDNVTIIVPNSDFISKQVINWSHTGNHVRISISIKVSYDSDPDLVSRLLLQVAENEEGVASHPAPVVRLTEFGDSGLVFSLLVWTHDYSDRRGALKSLLNYRVLKLFRDEKIKIPFPRQDVYLHSFRPEVPAK